MCSGKLKFKYIFKIQHQVQFKETEMNVYENHLEISITSEKKFSCVICSVLGRNNNNEEMKM